jgi:hypothetical protein
MKALFWFLAGALVSGVTSWSISRWYYLRAKGDSKADGSLKESVSRIFVSDRRELLQAFAVVAHSMEQQNLAKLSRDADGNITGITGVAVNAGLVVGPVAMREYGMAAGPRRIDRQQEPPPQQRPTDGS